MWCVYSLIVWLFFLEFVDIIIGELEFFFVGLVYNDEKLFLLLIY